MKLTTLDLQRSKGLTSGYKLEGLGPGFNVIVGANGSGKSSLCRAIAGLLWETEDFQGSAAGSWDVAGRRLSVLRESGAAPRWGDEGQPALPERRFRGCFSFSVDEFLNDEGTEAEIERVIRTELLAGFDLSQVFSSRRSNPAIPTASKLKNELVSSRRKREELAERHRDLLFEQQKLDEKSELREQAISAGDRVQLLKLAFELANKRVDLAQAAERLAEFPSSMQALRSDSRKYWEACESEVARCSEDLRKGQEKLAKAERALESCALEVPVSRDQLELLGRREQVIAGLEEEVRNSHQGEATAAANMQEARRALRGLSQASDGVLDRFSNLEALLTKLAELDARQAQADEKVVGVAESVEAALPDGPYAQGIGLLGSWLQAGASLPGAAWLPVVLGVSGLVLAASQLATSLASPVAWVLSLGLIAVAAWLWLQSRTDSRGHLQTEFERLFPASAINWQPETVARRIEELQAQMSEQEAQRIAREELQRAERQQRRVAEERAGFKAQLAELRAETGLEPAASNLRFLEVADELRRQVAAGHAFAEATATKETVRARKANELSAANEVLARFRMEPVENGADLRAATANLQDRERARQQACDELEQATISIASAKEQLAKGLQAREGFLQDLDLGEEGERELLRRLDRLDEWKQISEAHGVLKGEVRSLEKRLDEHPELLAYDPDLAAEVLAETQALASKLQPLNEELASLANKIERAQGGHEITDALDEERRKRDDLGDLRDELLEGAAADFLLEGVAEDHQNLSQPDILRDATELFGQFTRHRYELLAATYTGSGLPFEIRETDGVKKELTELSSGTRSQLGLALRVAVAKSVELDEPLPLVLDEALTNSDPERFRDVVRSLNEMVKLGRQIMFLTSDPADAARLEDVLKELDAEPARTFDLDQMRGEVRAAEVLSTQPIPSVLAPEEGESITAYAKRLRVPRIDAFAGVDALHLYYLCGEDCAGLHQLLRERVETVGRALHFLQGQDGVWDAAQRAKLQARRDVAAAWLDHYQVGRAPHLNPEVLRDGPLAKSAYIEHLVTINEELGGDARALIAAIDVKAKDRDPRLKRFNKNKRDELQGDLEKRGLFTEDEILSPAQRQERCLAAGQAHVAQGTVTREELAQLANAFEQWVGPTACND